MFVRRSLAKSSEALPAFGALRAYSAARPKVNDLYAPGVAFEKCPTPPASCSRTPCLCPGSDRAAVREENKRLLEEHSREWSEKEVEDATKNHVMFTWGATDAMSASAIRVVKGDGCYVVDPSGKKYLDFNSMAMCANLGHTVPESIVKAVNEQMKSVAYVYPGVSITPIRAKVSKLLAQIIPGHINSFLFPSGGAEANETALRIARVYTKRHKVISRYRSYHGATTATLTMTGDPRRLAAEMGATGHVHAFDPYPYSFSWGATPEEVADRSITYLKEQLAYEGPHTVAAIWLESVTGTNGILKPPPGYLSAVRELCDKHGILMVCDEVMAGFGRTGKWFGFCHENGVVPDLVTFAKGLTSSFVPLGGVGMSDAISAHFHKNPICIGSTYNGHPVALAAAYATLKYMIENDIVQHVADMEPLLQQQLQRMIDNHPSVKQARAVGLFGCMDIQKNEHGDFLAAVTDAPHPSMLEFKKYLLDRGLFTMLRGHTVYTNPPLIVTPKILKEGFDILDDALSIFDKNMGLPLHL